MIAPRVHRNGTSRDELTSQLEAVISALQTALQAAERAAPNGRDYYPLGPEVLTVALAEHRSRVERLQAVREEYAGIWEAIENA